MIEVEMIQDVRDTEPKVFGPFTKRQIICVLLAASYSVPLAIFLPLDIVFKIIIGFVAAAPVVACGWITMNKEPFEVLAARYIYKRFLTPRKRKYKVDNCYKRALKKAREQAEKEAVSKMTVKERRAYEKKKKKGKSVTYSKKKAYRIYR